MVMGVGGRGYSAEGRKAIIACLHPDALPMPYRDACFAVFARWLALLLPRVGRSAAAPGAQTIDTYLPLITQFGVYKLDINQGNYCRRTWSTS